MNSNENEEVLFLYATEGILECDESGRLLRVNPSCAKIFGYERSELEGQEIEVLLPRDLADMHRSQRKEFHGDPHQRAFGDRHGLVGLHKDGRLIPLEISLSPYTRNNKLFTIAFVVDITYRKQAEDIQRQHAEELERQVRNRTLILEEAIGQLEQTKNELNIALTREKELNMLKARFVSIVSHEFRTPLATMLSSVSLVKTYADLGDIEKRDKHIERIKTSIANLSDMLDDVLSLSRLEEGHYVAEPADTNIPQLLTELIDDIQPDVRTQQNIRYQHKGEKVYMIDAKILKLIVTNLLSNALKYSDVKSDVELRSELLDNCLRIVVTDHGIGIPSEDVPHVFERFYRAHNVMHIKGTGLGLNIVSKLIEVLKGRIEIESREHQGTIVTLTIDYEKNSSH